MSMDFEEVLVAYFNTGAVEEMEFEKTTNGMTRIIAHLKEGNQFTFVDDIKWGETLQDFYDTLDFYTNGVSYTFNNFDPQEELERQQERYQNFYGDY